MSGCQPPGDEVGDVRGVGGDAIDRPRPPAAQPRLADHEEAGHRRRAVALGDLAAVASDRRPHESRVSIEADGPDDGGDPGARKVELEGRPRDRAPGVWLVGGVRFGLGRVDPRAGDVRVDARSERL